MELYENLSKIQILRVEAKNYLHLLLRIKYGLLSAKCSKLVLGVLYSFCMFSIILTLYGFVTNPEITFISQYGWFFGFTIYMSINVGAFLWNQEQFKNMFELHELIRIPYEIVNEKLNNKFKFVSKVAIVLVCFNYALGLIFFGFFTYSYDYFNTKSYIRVWACNTLPGQCWFKISIVHVFDILTIFVMFTTPIGILYFTISGVFWVMLINQFVKDICASKIQGNERYDSELYQQLVEQKLKICIMLHDQLISNANKGAKIVNLQMVFFLLGTIIMGASLMLAITSAYHENNIIAFLCLNIFGFIISYSGSIYITAGQILKDESELIRYNLATLPWYYMNVQNLRMYSVLLRKSEKPIAITGDLVEVDFLLFIKIFRALYSMAALILRVSHNN